MSTNSPLILEGAAAVVSSSLTGNASACYDSNPRCSRFASYNAALNSVGHLVSASIADVRSAKVGGNVVANPPYVPRRYAPGMPLYTTGGDEGGQEEDEDWFGWALEAIQEAEVGVLVGECFKPLRGREGTVAFVNSRTVERGEYCRRRNGAGAAAGECERRMEEDGVEEVRTCLVIKDGGLQEEVEVDGLWRMWGDREGKVADILEGRRKIS